MGKNPLGEPSPAGKPSIPTAVGKPELPGDVISTFKLPKTSSTSAVLIGAFKQVAPPLTVEEEALYVKYVQDFLSLGDLTPKDMHDDYKTMMYILRIPDIPFVNDKKLDKDGKGRVSIGLVTPKESDFEGAWAFAWIDASDPILKAYKEHPGSYAAVVCRIEKAEAKKKDDKKKKTGVAAELEADMAKDKEPEKSFINANDLRKFGLIDIGS